MIIDIDTLNTLPDREFASGIAEVIKYGLIRDAEFFAWQEENMKKYTCKYHIPFLLIDACYPTSGFWIEIPTV